MSTICDDLRAAILQAAMQGSLTDSDSESWNESKIEDVCELCTGNSISENVKKAKYMKVVEGRNYIGTKDLLFDHSFNYENGVKIPFDETSFRIANRGDILLCIEGGSAGRKIGILEEDVNYGNKLCRFSPNDKLNNRFLYFYIQSPLFQEQFSDSMTGIIGGVSIKKIKAITIKYPDIAKQKCIVEKVDELMARVADLEQSADALASLKKAFPDDIKASLLQAAMQGKLTKQLPEDGSAEDLLEEIKAEKEKLISEGKIKKQKPLAPITDDEIPFSIPENWRWARLYELAILNPKNSADDNSDASFIPMTLVCDGYRNSHTYEAKKWGKIKKGFTHFADGDIGIAKITPCFQNRKSVIFKNLINGIGSGTTELSIVRPFPAIDNAYLLWIFKSPHFIENGIRSFTGTAGQQRIDKDYIKKYLIPLPPLAEQKRIVERLDTLIQNINVVEDLIASE